MCDVVLAKRSLSQTLEPLPEGFPQDPTKAPLSITCSKSLSCQSNTIVLFEDHEVPEYIKPDLSTLFCDAMSAQSPTIHVLDKSDYSKHRLVELPDEFRPSLKPSSLRFRPKILGLTTNNLTYARLGHLMGWYDIYPLPSNTPAPYNDSDVYGRISAWGYAEVIESTVPEIGSGQALYGYFPISTGLEDIRVEFAESRGQRIDGQLIVLDEHRQHLWKLYNRITLCAPLSDLEQTPGTNTLGWDSLMQGLFATAYNMSTYVFAWDHANLTHPSGHGAWTTADADLTDTTVIVLNASGKTAMGFAWALRHARPAQHQPRTLIGVSSEASLATVANSGFYDTALLNSAAETTAAALAEAAVRRVLLVNFGAREGAMHAWQTALEAAETPLTTVSVGGDVAVQGQGAFEMPVNQVNASLLREKGIEIGGAAYFEAFEASWREFIEGGGIVGMRLEWDEGMEGWEKGWEAFCRDEVRSDRGLVFRL
jgi:hypothetical protein